jgi:serine/threonine-protein kinase
MTDVFAIQDEICQAIVDRLRIQLAAGRSLVKHYTQNVEAYNLYLKARSQLRKMTAESMTKSREYYEQVIAVDPNYALGWFGLAEFYQFLSFHGYMPPKAANAQSSRAALTAVLRAVEFDWSGAEREFRRALELDPDSADVCALFDYYYLVPMRRLDEAVAATRRTLQLDPLSPFLQFRLGYWYYLTRQWDSAIEQCRNAIELDSNYYPAHFVLGLIHLKLGRFDEAIRAFETVTRLAAQSPFALGFLGAAYAYAGRTGAAQKILGQLQEVAQKIYVTPCSFAWINIGLGKIERGFDWFEKAVDQCDAGILHVHLHHDQLRSHPRYQALLRKMNLEP